MIVTETADQEALPDPSMPVPITVEAVNEVADPTTIADNSSSSPIVSDAIRRPIVAGLFAGRQYTPTGDNTAFLNFNRAPSEESEADPEDTFAEERSNPAFRFGRVRPTPMGNWALPIEGYSNHPYATQTMPEAQGPDGTITPAAGRLGNPNTYQYITPPMITAQVGNDQAYPARFQFTGPHNPYPPGFSYNHFITPVPPIHTSLMSPPFVQSTMVTPEPHVPSASGPSYVLSGDIASGYASSEAAVSQTLTPEENTWSGNRPSIAQPWAAPPAPPAPDRTRRRRRDSLEGYRRDERGLLVIDRNDTADRLGRAAEHEHEEFVGARRSGARRLRMARESSQEGLANPYATPDLQPTIASRTTAVNQHNNLGRNDLITPEQRRRNPYSYPTRQPPQLGARGMMQRDGQMQSWGSGMGSSDHLGHNAVVGDVTSSTNMDEDESRGNLSLGTPTIGRNGLGGLSRLDGLGRGIDGRGAAGLMAERRVMPHTAVDRDSQVEDDSEDMDMSMG